VLAIVVLLSTIRTAHADITLPKVLASYMVVQRQAPVHIWGWAAVGEKVTVSFRGEVKETIADNVGAWQVYLSPGKAGGPFELVVRGLNSIILNDILVGDLWIASGQSNMEMPMVGFPPGVRLKDAEKEIAAANYPQIRIMRLALTSSTYPLEDANLASSWQICSPESIRNFSAVAYFFARDLQSEEKVPIGIVDSTWGGTPAASWVSLPALTSRADLLPFLALYAGMMQNHAKDIRELATEGIQDEQKSMRQQPPKHGRHRDVLAWQPAALYNGMIAPLTPLPIKGVIWYQGEADRFFSQAPLYERVFSVLIADWRRAWAQGNFPFLYVQISSIGPLDAKPELVEVVREAQRRSLAVKNTAMVVSADLGDPKTIHPADKQDVGARLALAARAIAYQEPVEYNGPTLQRVTAENGALRIWFGHADGLVAKGNHLAGFEVAGDDQHFVPAIAKIERETVVVRSTQIAVPKYVRYAWEPNPEISLYNSEGLPASPFSSDDHYLDEAEPSD
jgi:sialate O-acetylesterase